MADHQLKPGFGADGRDALAELADAEPHTRRTALRRAGGIDVATLAALRASQPTAVQVAATRRRRRGRLLGDSGGLLLLAADHPARGALGAGGHGRAMADRHRLLERLLVALDRPGVDGVLGTADVVEDLLLLGALEGKVVLGSMNRGGLAGSVFELDDRMTGYSVPGLLRGCMDGGKMLLKVADDDPGTASTLAACAGAIDELAAAGLMALVEPLPAYRSAGGEVMVDSHPDRTARAIAVASGLGSTSAHTWLKVPVVEEMERVMHATTLPTLLLGGDPGAERDAVLERWGPALRLPQVFGVVAGRSLLFPPDDDVEGAVDTVAEMVASSCRRGSRA